MKDNRKYLIISLDCVYAKGCDFESKGDKLYWFGVSRIQTQASQGPSPLQWRHNERDGVSNHGRLNCLLNC